MALIKCPECGNDVSDLAHACPKCGRPLNPYNAAAAAQPQAARAPAPLASDRVLIAILVGVLTFGYMLPWAIAHVRRHNQQVPIFLIDLLLGWTFFGWIAALIWAFTSDVQPGSV